MSEPDSYSMEWLEAHAWQPTRKAYPRTTVEDLDEFEGVIEALSKLESNSKEDTSQSRVSHTKFTSTSVGGGGRLANRRISDVASSVSSTSLAWDPTTDIPSTWQQKLHMNNVELASQGVQNQEPETSGSVYDGEDESSMHDFNTGKSHHFKQHEDHHHRKRNDGDVTVYDEKFGKIFLEEEALRRRVGDLEQKVNLLMAEDYYQRVSVPRGCFVIVLPGPSYAHKFTEDLLESFQSRIESVWPLCYFSPVIARLANLASAMLSWLPLPAPVYTCEFPPDMHCQSPRYEPRQLQTL